MAKKAFEIYHEDLTPEVQERLEEFMGHEYTEEYGKFAIASINKEDS